MCLCRWEHSSAVLPCTQTDKPDFIAFLTSYLKPPHKKPQQQPNTAKQYSHNLLFPPLFSCNLNSMRSALQTCILLHFLTERIKAGLTCVFPDDFWKRLIRYKWDHWNEGRKKNIVGFAACRLTHHKRAAQSVPKTRCSWGRATIIWPEGPTDSLWPLFLSDKPRPVVPSILIIWLIVSACCFHDLLVLCRTDHNRCNLLSLKL